MPTPGQSLAVLAILLAVGSLVFATAYPLLAVAVILISVAKFVP